MDYIIKKATESDLDFALSLNQTSLSAVSHSNLKQMKYFLDVSSYFKILCIENSPVGFLIGLMPGMDYKSENYLWVNRIYQSFIYIDRVIIDAKNRNKGLGSILYDDLVKSFQGNVENVICEVNVKPYNSQSLHFHEKYGFKEIGQKDIQNGTKRVSYLIYKINENY